MTTIVEIIKNMCSKNNITIKELEEKTGLSNGSIGKWDTSSPKISNIIKIADYFNVSVDYLLGRNNNFSLLNSGIEAETTTCAIGYIDFLGTIDPTQNYNSEQELNAYKKMYSLLLKACNSVNDNMQALISFRIFSDNIIIAIPITEKYTTENAIGSIILTLAYFQYYALIGENKTIRGGLGVGELYMDNLFVFGNGLINAYDIENRQAIYPRIALDNVFNYAENNIVDNINNEMYKSIGIKFINLDFDGRYYIDFLNVCHLIEKTDVSSALRFFLTNRLSIHEIIGSNLDRKKMLGILLKKYWLYVYIISKCDNNHIQVPQTILDDISYIEKNYKENKSIYNAIKQYYLYDTSSDSAQSISLAYGFEDDIRAVAYGLDNEHYIPEDDEDEIKTT